MLKFNHGCTTWRDDDYLYTRERHACEGCLIIDPVEDFPNEMEG